MKRRIYYAHPMCMYRRPAERRQLLAIRRRFRNAQIVNPARYDQHPEKLRDTLGFCLRLIESCDVVVFSRILGKVTAGVRREINHALSRGTPVLELSDGGFTNQTRRVRFVDRRSTIRLYERWRRTNFDWAW